MFVNFINKSSNIFFSIFVIFTTLICLSVTAQAESRMMICNSTIYKFDEMPERKVFKRSEASWKSWCDGKETINDLGAWCDYKRDYTINTGTKIEYVDKEDIKFATNVLTKRHYWCSNNPDDEICNPFGKNRIHDPHDGDVVSINRVVYPDRGKNRVYKEEKVPEEKPDLIQSFDFSCDGSAFDKPWNEDARFFEIPLNEYIASHLPKLGETKCTIRNLPKTIRNVKVRDTLDFLLYEKVIVPKGNDELNKKIVDCEKFE